MTILGVVLAGGQSRRFGSDKALAELEGRPLLAHAAALLLPFVEGIVVVGRSQAMAFQTVADWPEPGLGPLGGICGAVRHAAGAGHEAILCVPCDMPHIPATLLRQLAGCGGAAHVAQAPVVARWPITFLPHLVDRLTAGSDRSIAGWARAIGSEPVEWGEPLVNVNRVEELAALAADNRLSPP